MTLNGAAASATTTTAADGTYAFFGLTDGSYTVKAAKAPWTFAPETRSIAINGDNATGQDFTGSLATVTISANIPTASEGGASGSFKVTRTGSKDFPLTVNYTVSGTATKGTDYAALNGAVTIPTGWTSMSSNVIPIDDASPEDRESVIVTLSAGTGYQVGSPSSATVSILAHRANRQVHRGRNGRKRDRLRQTFRDRDHPGQRRGGFRPGDSD